MNTGPFTFCVIFYGWHPRLARQFLEHMYEHTPVGAFSLRVGLNEACAETVELVEAAARRYGNIWVHSEPVNIYKSPLMSKLLWLRPLETEWVVWFDDDSFVYRPDWLPALRLKIGAQPEVDVWGDPLYTEADQAALDFVRSAAWYRGLPLEHALPTGARSEKPLLYFVAGGFWVARRQVLEALRWPDPRLVQNEDDFMFGEALRQNGFKMGRFKSGVRINQAERRCPVGVPPSYGPKSARKHSQRMAPAN